MMPPFCIKKCLFLWVFATMNETVSIRAGHSRIVVFTIPASSVQTGVQVWTTMHAHVSTSY